MSRGDMDGWVSLITGANGGIGRAIATGLARRGSHLILHQRAASSGDQEFAKALAQECAIECVWVDFDVTDYDVAKEQVSRVLNRWGRLDVLVNNAGVAHGGLAQMTTLDQVKIVFETNFFAPLSMTQLVLRRMVKAGRGAVINVSSIAGQDLHAGNVAYGSSKAALIALTQTLAAEVGGLGVRINAVAPGLTDTRMATMMESKAAADMIASSAMKRLAKPEEVASVVVFLASDEAAFVNGEVIRIDGGRA